MLVPGDVQARGLEPPAHDVGGDRLVPGRVDRVEPDELQCEVECFGHRGIVQGTMPSVPARDTSRAAAEAASLAGAGSTDPLIGDLRRAGLLQLLVLHYVAGGPSYGNQLIERIGALTTGALVVNPNTMYPLLRSLEERGLVAGEWEHPERRSRRFYRITAEGRAERDRLIAELEPRLKRIERSIRAIRKEAL
jgi:DNA-binding PadR family transcriptional regulator